MSTATVTVRPFPALGPGVRRVEVDCRHAVTGVTYANAPGGVQLTDADATRVALARHYHEERCTCTAKLWRKFWETEPGELPLVRGRP